MAGPLRYDRFGSEPAITDVVRVLGQYGGLPGVEVTLRCTGVAASNRSPSFWRETAHNCGCLWFRVLGPSAEESVVLGLARGLAAERRLDRLTVIEADSAQLSIAVVGRHGHRLAYSTWQGGGVIDECARRASVELEAIRYDVASLESGDDGPFHLAGVGQFGPQVAALASEHIENAELLKLDNAAILPAVGVLHANIVREFEMPIPRTRVVKH